MSLGLGAAGCTGPAESGSQNVPLPLWTGQPIASASLVVGELRVDDRGCLGWVQADGRFRVLVWPDTYRAALIDGRVVVADAAGQVVAREGELMNTNGGFDTDLPAGFKRCAAADSAAVIGPNVRLGAEPSMPTAASTS